MSDPTQEILDKLNTIEEKINKVQQVCNEIQTCCISLNERLEKIEISTGVMDEHVQW